MKKTWKIVLALGLSLSFALPAFAAYNDVLLTSDTVISVNGITINVTGTTASIASITVDATSFSVSLEAGSTFKVNAPNANDLAALPAISSAFYTCTATDATLEYKSVTATQTVTITPSAAVCNAGISSSGGTSGSSGGGGGSPAPQASPVAQLVTNPNFSSMTPSAKQAAIAQIRTALIPLIQQLIILLTQELQAMQASGNY